MSPPVHLADTESCSATTYRLRAKDLVVGAQMLFIAFGALMLVPILTGLNPGYGIDSVLRLHIS